MKIRIIALLIACLCITPLVALTPGKRARLMDLIKDLEQNKVSEHDARSRALNIHITGSDMNDAKVTHLMQLAESKGIHDIFNPAFAPKKAVTQEPAQPTIPTEISIDIAEPHMLFTLQDSPNPESVPLFMHDIVNRLNNYAYSEVEALALRAKNMHDGTIQNPYADKTEDSIMQTIAPIITKITNPNAQWDAQSLIETYYQLILARMRLKTFKYKNNISQKIVILLCKYHRKDAQSEPLYVAEMIDDFERENKVDESNDRENRFKR